MTKTYSNPSKVQQRNSTTTYLTWSTLGTITYDKPKLYNYNYYQNKERYTTTLHIP